MNILLSLEKDGLIPSSFYELQKGYATHTRALQEGINKVKVANNEIENGK